MVAKIRNTTGRDDVARPRIAEQISRLIVLVTIVVLPLLVSVTGKDAFRLPKLLLLQASGITLAAIAACAMVIGTPLWRDRLWPRELLITISITLTWSVVTAVFSTNRTLSVLSVLTTAAATMFFVGTYNAMQDRSLTVIYVGLAPAVVNAGIAIAQRTALWNLFATSETSGRLRAIALLGNPDDVGMFLVAPILAAAALSATATKHRVPGAAIAAVLSLGLVSSETVGAIVAASAGLFLLVFALHPRRALAAAIMVLFIAGFAVRLSPQRWGMTVSKVAAMETGDFDSVLSGRLPAFRAAWMMFQEHPIAGVGPGCFGFNYFDAKLLLNATGKVVPRFYRDPNFGEAHNEHLQILAENGLPGYLIFIGSLLILASRSLRRISGRTSPKAAFARCLAMPLAVALAVLTMSSFPLRLAAPTAIILFICALTLSWAEHEDM